MTELWDEIDSKAGHFKKAVLRFPEIYIWLNKFHEFDCKFWIFNLHLYEEVSVGIEDEVLQDYLACLMICF